MLLFDCAVGDMAEAARAAGITGGVWLASAESPLGLFDIAGVREIDDPELSVGKFIVGRETGRPRS